MAHVQGQRKLGSRKGSALKRIVPGGSSRRAKIAEAPRPDAGTPRSLARRMVSDHEGEGDLVDLAATLSDAIPAASRLASTALREAVLRTWAASLERSPYPGIAESPQAPHMPGRSLVKHVNEVNQRTLDLLEVASLEFGLAPDADVTLATAILHDVDKPMIYRWDGRDFRYADGRSLQDHGAVGAELCLAHGVPLEVAEMVRHHSAFASEGLPGTIEGTIVHYADFISNDFAAIVSGVETIHASTRLVPRSKG